jgi:O-antigen/teichoic acid export membrane protein
MKKLIKQLLGESAIYGISSMIAKFISLFLVPLYTSLISPAEYGELSLVNTTFYFIIVFAVFAMDNSAARWYYDTEDVTERKKTVATWFWFQLSVSVVLASVVIGLSSYLSQWILHNNSSIFFILPACGLLSSILPTIVSNWLRFQRKAIHAVVFTLSNVCINVVLNLWFVYHLKLGVQGILTATLLSNCIASIYVFTLLHGWIKFSFFSLDRLKEMLRFAMPLLPTSIAFWVLNSSSSYIIEFFHGKAEVGLYSVGNMIAAAVTMVVGAFQMAWGPFAFSIIEKPEAKNTFSVILTLYSVVMSFVALTVALFAKEALQIFTNERYHSAYDVAGILAFNGIIYGYAYIASIGASIAKDNKPLAIGVLFAAILTAFLYFLLVPTFGKEGAACSMALGYTIVPIYLFYRSQKLWHITFKFGITVFSFLLAIAIFIFSSTFSYSTNSTEVISKFLLLLLYLFGIYIYAVNVYPSIHWKLIWAHLQTRLKKKEANK